MPGRYEGEILFRRYEENGSPSSDDLILIDDVSESHSINKKVTVGNLLANIYSTTITATTFSGTNVYATTITATTISGTISADNVKATTLTGTTFSGTNVYATTITATTLSGSLLLPIG